MAEFRHSVSAYRRVYQLHGTGLEMRRTIFPRKKARENSRGL
jgi:hypothetical protein